MSQITFFYKSRFRALASGVVRKSPPPQLAVAANVLAFERRSLCVTGATGHIKNGLSVNIARTCEMDIGLPVATKDFSELCTIEQSDLLSSVSPKHELQERCNYES